MTEAKSHSTEQDIDSEFVEVYKTYANTTLDVSNRRLRNNRFYVVLLSGTLAVISVLTDLQILTELGLLLAGMLGMALCGLWYLSILSYKQLNSGKYDVIQEMENELPFGPFTREWELLDKGGNWRIYLTHTRVERKIPVVLAIPYLLIVIYALLDIA